MGYNPLDFKIGLAMGHVSPARYLAKPEPVAYLYGTIEKPLPALPKVSGYEYILIYQGIVGYIALYSPIQLIMKNDGYIGIPQEVGTVEGFRYIEPDRGNTEWRDMSSVDLSYSWINVHNPLWTTHAIHNEDGTLYLAGSDPVPVYELEE